MQQYFSLFSNSKDYYIELLSGFGLAELLRVCLALSILPLSYSISLSLGNIVDIHELLFMLDESLIVECIGLSVVGVLLINPFLIEQLWRIFYFLFKAFYGTFLNKRHVAFTVPSLCSVEHSAHGCRAPPSF